MIYVLGMVAKLVYRHDRIKLLQFQLPAKIWTGCDSGCGIHPDSFCRVRTYGSSAGVSAGNDAAEQK
jgi:hypothetical protein